MDIRDIQCTGEDDCPCITCSPELYQDQWRYGADDERFDDDSSTDSEAVRISRDFKTFMKAEVAAAADAIAAAEAKAQ